MTLKELADLGAAAAFANNKYHHYMSVSKQSHSWESDEPARQAFAAAVRDAVLAELATKSDSSPVWQLPDPPSGREWHRADWTEEMLPDGYRPLLKDERIVWGEGKDEYMGNWEEGFYNMPNRWHWQSHYRTAPLIPDHGFWRTTRPLPSVTKTIPLDMGDIRATDEFKSKWSHVIETADYWCDNEVGLAWSGDAPTYEDLARSYLRRQHGSTEWKPCTKEITA